MNADADVRCTICGGEGMRYSRRRRNGTLYIRTEYIECRSCGKRASASGFEGWDDYRAMVMDRWVRGVVE